MNYKVDQKMIPKMEPKESKGWNKNTGNMVKNSTTHVIEILGGQEREMGQKQYLKRQ